MIIYRMFAEIRKVKDILRRCWTDIRKMVLDTGEKVILVINDKGLD